MYPLVNKHFPSLASPFPLLKSWSSFCLLATSLLSTPNPLLFTTSQNGTSFKVLAQLTFPGTLPTTVEEPFLWARVHKRKACTLLFPPLLAPQRLLGSTLGATIPLLSHLGGQLRWHLLCHLSWLCFPVFYCLFRVAFVASITSCLGLRAHVKYYAKLGTCSQKQSHNLSWHLSQGLVPCL